MMIKDKTVSYTHTHAHTHARTHTHTHTHTHIYIYIYIYKSITTNRHAKKTLKVHLRMSKTLTSW